MLRREVEPPPRQPTGLGVMLLASAAMFFAVAGSAFIVRSQMTGGGCPGRIRAIPPRTALPAARGYDELRPADAAAMRFAAPPADCQIITRTGDNGEQLVDFHLCPDPQ